MLWQFQCQKDGTLFYYQWVGPCPPSTYIVDRCPVCGSKRVTRTGRKYPDLDEEEEQEQDSRVETGFLIGPAKPAPSDARRSIILQEKQ